MKTDKDTVLVVIPFWAKGAQGNELELAITGWRKFFKEDFLIVVVGDWHRVTDADDIEFIPCPQVSPVPGQYLPHLDHVHKFRKVREHFPKSKGFVYTCDDIYPTADITLDDIIFPKYPERGFYFETYNWTNNPVDWYRDKMKTGDLCTKNGLPRRNWVCHLPVYYEWDRLLAIYDKHDCDHISYIVENIYFNEMYPDDPHAVNCLEFRDEVRTSYPDIRPIGSVKWITNANCGWSVELERMLEKHYFGGGNNNGD